MDDTHIYHLICFTETPRIRKTRFKSQVKSFIPITSNRYFVFLAFLCNVTVKIVVRFLTPLMDNSIIDKQSFVYFLSQVIFIHCRFLIQKTAKTRFKSRVGKCKGPSFIYTFFSRKIYIQNMYFINQINPR